MQQKPSFADWKATVEGTANHSKNYTTLQLGVSCDFPEAHPGQFVMIEAGCPLGPYLRRAFSIAALSRREKSVSLEILIKVVGRGTRNLVGSRPGETLRVLGPLGQGFVESHSEAIILVGGGVGVAPLLMLAQSLVHQGKTFDFYYGGRSLPDLPRLRETKELAEASGGQLVATSEDGTVGHKGLVTSPLQKRLEEGRLGYIYTCGPQGLMKALAIMANKFGISGEAALETNMGCGFGACLGCVVRRVDGTYALCCKNGPVFPFEEIQW